MAIDHSAARVESQRSCERPSARRHTRGEAASRLSGWLARAGGRSSALSLDRAPTAGLEARAGAGISAGARVFQIPLSCLVTRAVVEGSAVGQRVAASGVSLRSAHSLFALFLLHEDGSPRSPFRPYLDTLPRAFPTFPLLSGEADLALLQGSTALARIATRRASIRHDYQALRAGVPALDGLPYESFLHARITVTSRIFALTIDGEKTEALVPLADMLNHRHPPETRWTYDEEAGAFVMTALRSFAAGEPVHDSYGPKCNSRFLVSYGFALEENEENEAAVRLGGASGGTFQISARPDDDATQAALSFLRRAHASGGERERMPPGGEEVAPLGPRNESLALRALAAACEEALRAFPTTLEQDDALLAEGRIGLRERFCVIQRRGEKRVLRGWIDLAAAALPILRLPWARLQQAVRARAGDAPLDRYLRSVRSAVAARRRAERPTLHEEASP